MSYSAYKSTQRASATNDPRDLEYRLLAQVTGHLIKARDGEASLQEKLDAVLRNEKIWGVFLADLNDAENRLPKQLRVGLANLALFVIKETALVMETDAGLDDLIMINRQIMAGLKPEPAALAG